MDQEFPLSDMAANHRSSVIERGLRWGTFTVVLRLSFKDPCDREEKTTMQEIEQAMNRLWRVRRQIQEVYNDFLVQCAGGPAFLQK